MHYPKVKTALFTVILSTTALYSHPSEYRVMGGYYEAPLHTRVTIGIYDYPRYPDRPCYYYRNRYYYGGQYRRGVYYFRGNRLRHGRYYYRGYPLRHHSVRKYHRRVRHLKHWHRKKRHYIRR